VGADADVTVFDPDREWVFRVAQSASKSKNSPFDGWPLKGKAVATLVQGRLLWSEPPVREERGKVENALVAK